MPELPEVETIRRSIDPHVVGRRVVAVDIRTPRLRLPLDERFRRALLGRRIESTSRRGKYLLLHLDDGNAWFLHMGMSGRLRLAGDGEGAPGLHDHLAVALDDGQRLMLHDPRRFGLSVVDHPEASRLVAGLGPEPLDRQAFDAAHLASWKARSRRSIKDVLMDQRVVAGLGNIYVNEILFRAGLRPRRRLTKVTGQELVRIVDATRAVIAEAIEHRGSSISDFLDGIGRRGGYQWRHCVYDREGEECLTCRAPIRAIVVGQRSSFYCPRCQT